ncbi:MAG: RidA family protein [Rhizomicrobium sp.]|nr:RidA family protein [Rhizomicrobium sp.]
MRKLITSGSKFEPILGFSRAVRVGNHISVSGTAANGPDGTVGIGDAGAQARQIFKTVAGALADAGASLDDVVRTRIMLRNIEDWKAVGDVHGEVFAKARPATCFVEVSRFIDPEWLVEIEVDAIVEGDTP